MDLGKSVPGIESGLIMTVRRIKWFTGKESIKVTKLQKSSQEIIIVSLN